MEKGKTIKVEQNLEQLKNNVVKGKRFQQLVDTDGWQELRDDFLSYCQGFLKDRSNTQLLDYKLNGELFNMHLQEEMRLEFQKELFDKVATIVAIGKESEQKIKEYLAQKNK